MPKLSGMIKIQGSADDLTFFKTRTGYKWRKQVKMEKDRMATDPAFARTRENNREFTSAAGNAKLLRRALALQLKEVNDGSMFRRLFSALLKITKSDPVSDRGSRNAALGDLSLLKDFDFNSTALLDKILVTGITTTTDRVNGKHEVKVNPFTPSKQVEFPGGATHFKIISMAVDIDFVLGDTQTSAAESASIPVMQNTPVAVPEQQHVLSAGSTHPLLLVVGIVFLMEVNGKEYPLNDKSFNALRILAADYQ